MIFGSDIKWEWVSKPETFGEHVQLAVGSQQGREKPHVMVTPAVNKERTKGSRFNCLCC